MSIEIWQFPETASRDELVRSLQSLNYEKGKNLFWPGPRGTISLFWFDYEDFKSVTGVDASVFPLDSKGKEAWNTKNDWALRTRTSISASSFDREFQNHTVRRIRQTFGGRFYNDHFGHNRYNEVDKPDSCPPSRGVYALLIQIRDDLDSLEHALPDESIKILSTPAGDVTIETDKTGVLGFSKQYDPARVVYNALVPFLIAAIEHFFRATFEIMLKYDERAQQSLEDQNKKVSFTEASALAKGHLTIERITSGWYSFQNLNSVQRAFKDVLGIDVMKAIRRRRKIRNRLPVISESFTSLIGARHGVIHGFSLNRKLDREGFLDLLNLVRAVLDIMEREIETKLGMTLGPG